MFIDSATELAAFCERAASSPMLALDTEFLRERTFRPQPCVLQVGTHDEQAAVDVIALTGEALEPLRDLLFDRARVKVLHACGQDLEIFQILFGDIPEPIFDTQVAAAFVGHRLQMGYGALVESVCGVHLPKTESLTDWTRRPLDPEQVSYAEDDVRYLPAVYDDLVSELVRLDRLTWVLPEMEALVVKARCASDPEDAFHHVKRVGTLNGRQLAVCREVAAWRERKASQRDVPRKWLLSDEVVIEVSKRMPRTQERLRRVRGTAQLKEKDGDAIVLAVRRGLSCPQDRWPKVTHRPRPTQESESVVDLMNALVRLVAERESIAPQLVSGRDDLLAFLDDPASSRLGEGWRRDLMGGLLADLLAGRAGLTVKDGHVELL